MRVTYSSPQFQLTRDGETSRHVVTAVHCDNCGGSCVTESHLGRFSEFLLWDRNF
jgi:hypothetical protein